VCGFELCVVNFQEKNRLIKPFLSNRVSFKVWMNDWPDIGQESDELASNALAGIKPNRHFCGAFS
jgi:hypothetical protein